MCSIPIELKLLSASFLFLAAALAEYYSGRSIILISWLAFSSGISSGIFIGWKLGKFFKKKFHDSY